MNAGTCFGRGFAIAALVLLGCQLAAASDGRTDRATLDAMGLGGLTVISDDEAESVRGQGFKGGAKSAAVVWGSSWAVIHTRFGSAGSENGYFARGKRFAKGSNFSFAGIDVIDSNGKNHKGNSGKTHRGGKFGGHNGGKFGGKGGKFGGHHGGKGGHRIKPFKVFAGGSSRAIAK